MAKRRSALKFLNDDVEESKDSVNADDSTQESPLLPQHLMLRAHSPSPIRKRGSLQNLFNASDSGSMAMTGGLDEISEQKPKKLTVREIEDTFKDGDIPDTCYRDLPPTFNEVSERKRAETQLFIERMDYYLTYFYREMNDCAYKHGLKASNFAVAHGMHHYNNYSSAIDMAKLSRIALTQHELLGEIVNSKLYEVPSRINIGFTYEWKNTNFLLWHQDPMGTFAGIKTGVTPTAGPCLAVTFKSRCGNFDFVIVVMNCKTREARFVEIPKLVRWAMNRI